MLRQFVVQMIIVQVHEKFGRKSVATLTLIFNDLHELFLLIYVKNQKSEFEYLRLTTIFYKFRWH